MSVRDRSRWSFGAAVALIALLVPLWTTAGSARADGIGKLTQFSYGIPGEGEETPDSVVEGPEGSMWFGLARNGDLMRMTSKGKVEYFPGGFREEGEAPSIAVGEEGDLWFTTGERPFGAIGRMTPGGTLTEFTAGIVEPSRSVIESDALGPEGDIWFTQIVHGASQQIGRITPEGAVTEFPLAAEVGAPQTITAGPEGDMWFAALAPVEAGSELQVDRIDAEGEVRRLRTGVTAGYGRTPDIAAGPEGDLWVAVPGSSEPAAPELILRVSPEGEVSDFTAGLTPGSSPQGIVAGAEGDLWFRQRYGSELEVGRITPAGVVAEFPIARTAGYESFALGPGPEHTMWFPMENGPARFIAKIGTQQGAGSGYVLKSVSPGRGPAAGGTRATISGYCLDHVTQVLFGSGVAGEVTETSPTSITVTVPPGASGTVPVTVATACGTTEASKKAKFKYENPTVSAISPAHGPLAGGTPVTITGSGFVPGTSGTTFAFGKALASAVNCSSSTECTALTPAAAKAGAVAVIAADGKAKSKKGSPGDQFTYE